MSLESLWLETITLSWVCAMTAQSIESDGQDVNAAWPRRQQSRLGQRVWSRPYHFFVERLSHRRSPACATRLRAGRAGLFQDHVAQHTPAVPGIKPFVGAVTHLT